MLTIARDQTGAFHVLRDGSPIRGPLPKESDAMRVARSLGGGPAYSVGRMYYEPPQPAEPFETATATAIAELLAGTVTSIGAALDTGAADHLLDEIEAAERAAHNRKGVLSAVARRRASP